ncbi:hypothetical protein MSG28_007052 [Choristoneura fumiferana]|uniref:Uncharacterized protein n=1 Tax=Choristoneura fumiferana TaxID=7141 RepID=A0ACC0JMI3_CHOFU|nr:hypothetical protein MSG28_007052 [Choristoneura fumiferana]
MFSLLRIAYLVMAALTSATDARRPPPRVDGVPLHPLHQTQRRHADLMLLVFELQLRRKPKITAHHQATLNSSTEREDDALDKWKDEARLTTMERCAAPELHASEQILSQPAKIT